MTSATLRQLAKRLQADGVRRLVVLDSSFNPPTVAHAAILRQAATRIFQPSVQPGRDACLLLIAERNADKGDISSDTAQRLRLMSAFAKDCEDVMAPIHIATTASPLFIDKLVEAQSGQIKPEMMAVHFVMGHDTVVRFLDPKYYQGDRDEDGVPSGLKVFFEKHQGKIVVAPRTAEDGASSIIIPVCLSNYISEMDPLDTATMLVSSTRVRNAIQCGDLDAVKQLVTPSVYKLLTQN